MKSNTSSNSPEGEPSRFARSALAHQKYLETLSRDSAAINAVPMILENLRQTVRRYWLWPTALSGLLLLIAQVASVIFCCSSISGASSRLSQQLEALESSSAAILQSSSQTSDRLAALEQTNKRTLPGKSSANPGLPFSFRGADGSDCLVVDTTIYESAGRYFVEVSRNKN